MRMPAVIIRHHRHRDEAKLSLACQLGLLQVRHSDHIHAQAAIHIRFGPGGKLGALHAQVSSAALGGDADLLARSVHHLRQLAAYRIGESYMRHHSIAEKRIQAMPRTIEELVRDYELQRLMFFLQRTYGGNGNYSLDTKLLESVDV